MILTPLPLVLVAVRGGAGATATAFGVATLLLLGTPWGEGVPAWAFVLGYGPIVAFVLTAMRHMHAVNQLVLGGVVLSAGLGLLHLTVSAQWNDRTMVEEYRALATATETALLDNPAVEDLDAERRAQVSRAAPLLVQLLPAIAIGQYASSLALACWCCVLAVRRFRLAEVPRLPLATWRLPEWAIVGFLAPAAGLLLAVRAENATAVTVFGNGLTLVLCVYFFQGWAILHAFLRRMRAPFLVQALVFAALFLVPVLLTVVLVAGLFDFQVDFRRRWMPTSAAPGERPEI